MHVGHIQCIHYTFEGKAKIINIPFLYIYIYIYNNMAAILNFLILLRLFIIQHELLFHATIIFRRFYNMHVGFF